MTDTTHEAPERIWVWGWRPCSGWQEQTWQHEDEPMSTIEYVRADLVQAAVAAERDRCTRVAFDAGCGWQALRTAALSSSWPEDAAKHLASEHAAFAIAALIRKGGE